MDDDNCYPQPASTRKKCPKFQMTYSRPRPDVLQTLFRSKANPNYKARKLWYELNMPECASNILDGKMLSSSMPDSLLCHTPQMTGKKRVTVRKQIVKKNYLKMRAEREEFRKKLVTLITGSDDDDDIDEQEAAACAEFPNKAEREELRYYYYIKYGIDTVHVSPINGRTLNRIKTLIPPKLNKWAEELEENFNEIKSDYIYAMKKAMVDFVLKDCKPEFMQKEQVALTSEREELQTLTNRYRFRYEDNRCRLKKILFSIHRSVAHILEIWNSKYKYIVFVDAQALSQREEPFELYDFAYKCGKQIESVKDKLDGEWYKEIHGILLKASKKNQLPDVRRIKLLRCFYNCVAALMTQQLEDICIRSLHAFTDFVCDYNRANKGIIISLLLEDEDTIVFNPSFAKIQAEYLRIIETITTSVMNMPRIENKLYTDLRISDAYALKPAVPESIVAAARNRICAMLEEQRIGPELRLQDFDKYIDLMNGKDAEALADFIELDPPFEEYCEMLYTYREKEFSIAKDIWGVIRMELYEFHRESFITQLENFARYMQTTLLNKMVADQQGKISRLSKEYETIAKKALTIPQSTSELMELKEYVINVQENVVPEMEQRLKVVCIHNFYNSTSEKNKTTSE